MQNKYKPFKFDENNDLSIKRKFSIEDSLHQREEEITAILDSSPMLMIIVDEERRVIKSNNAAGNFSGRTVDEMANMRVGEAIRCLNSMQDKRGCGFSPACKNCLVRITVEETLNTDKSHSQIECHLPFINNGKQEELIFLLYTSILKLPKKLAIVWIEDITELKKALENVKQAKNAIEAANKELEAFSYSVSHDLRAPLRSIDGFSHALLEDYDDILDEEGKQYLTRIRSSSQLMAQLIDDILNLTKISRAEMKLEQVNLSALASEVAGELKRIEPSRKVDFIIAPNLEAEGDKLLLKLVFENLLGNAFKFTSKRSSAKIKFGITQKEHDQVYFISDNGTGFDMTYVNKLFKPFQRLHSDKDFPGTGIGLASVQRIINKMGGKVWAEGEINKGATFYFKLR